MTRKAMLLAVILVLFGAHRAEACSCVRVSKYVPADEWLSKYSGTVFRGKVISITSVRRSITRSEPLIFASQRLVTFEVETMWKGENRKQLKVATGYGNGDCGVEYEIGRMYFVAASEWEKELSTGICNTVGLDMKTLGKLGPGRKPTR
jgi:hypothetical protein